MNIYIYGYMYICLNIFFYLGIYVYMYICIYKESRTIMSVIPETLNWPIVGLTLPP